MSVQIAKGDITRFPAEAIVNAANADLLPGGGVCGAIHAAAGPLLAIECQNVAGWNPAKPGDVRITGAWNLTPARFIFHAVGPRWDVDSNARQLLARVYYEIIRWRAETGVGSIVIPCISTGIYGFPKPAAARIAVHVLAAMPLSIETTLIAFGDDDYNILERAMWEFQS
jgi:O-acetyl-ADP-ribose deacetylase (regulator of RNase III)